MATATSKNATKEALLAAAREEFAAHGIAGARVDRIAQRAGVNKERIYGYFGSKEKLFDAVMQDALNELTRALSSPGDDPAGYVGELFDFYREHPNVLRLCLWEALHGRDHDLPQQQWRAEMCQSKVEALAGNLGREPSPDVGRIMFTLIGLAAFPSVLPQVARLMIGETAGEPHTDASTREHVVAFARAALSGHAANGHQEAAQAE